MRDTTVIANEALLYDKIQYLKMFLFPQFSFRLSDFFLLISLLICIAADAAAVVDIRPVLGSAADAAALVDRRPVLGRSDDADS